MARLRRMWSRTPRRVRVIGIAVLAFTFVQSMVWNFTYNVWMGQQYDAPGTWCAQCPGPLDGIFETIENTLLMMALGVTLGIPVGLALRLRERWRRAH